jgi:P63C domain
MFCMMAGTQKGREIRIYFLNCEAELKRRIEEERNQSSQDRQRQLVAAMVSKDVVSRQSRFPDSFYEMLYRKRGNGWENRDPKKFRPSCVGTWTNNTVYDRMIGGTGQGGLKDTLNKVNPRRENGTRKNKHHYHLKEFGVYHLETHLYALTAIANTVPDGNWDMFMHKVKQAFPNNEALQLTLWDIYDQMEATDSMIPC